MPPGVKVMGIRCHHTFKSNRNKKTSLSTGSLKETLASFKLYRQTCAKEVHSRFAMVKSLPACAAFLKDGDITFADVTSDTPTPRVVGMRQKIVRPVAKATGVNGSLMVAHPSNGVTPAMLNTMITSY